MLEEPQQKQFQSLVEMSKEKEVISSEEPVTVKPSNLYLIECDEQFSFVIPTRETELQNERHYFIGNIYNFYGSSYIQYIKEDGLDVVGGNTYGQKLFYNTLIFVFFANLSYFIATYFFQKFEQPAILSPSILRYYQRFNKTNESN